MKEISLHLLDIAENSIAAGAKRIRIIVKEDSRSDLLQMIIEDNGRGMSADMVKRVVDPFTTTRTTRKVGLGIPLLKASAEACNGFLTIESQIGMGTKLTVQFQRSHIDRMPLGDLITTILNLLVANPQVHWIFKYEYNGNFFCFDDVPIKNELHDLPLTEPAILKCIKEMLKSGIMEVNPDFSTDQVSIS